MSNMRTMSSKQIKDRYGEFVEAARREPILHTSHGRPVLVTLSIDRAREIPQLREMLEPSGQPAVGNKLWSYLGKGEAQSRFKSTDEADAAIRKMRDEWP